MENKLTKSKASKILRGFINIPARTISRIMKKKAIEDKLKEFNVCIKIN